MKIFGIVRSAAQLITDAFTAGDLRQPNLTLRGNIATESILITPAGSAPSVADVDDDAIVPAQTVSLGITENYVFNTAAGAWNRMLSIPDNADGQAALTQGTPGVIARLQGWNGATWDRRRCNHEFVVLASAVRAATNNSADFVNYNSASGLFFLDVTAVPGVQTVQLLLQVKDPVSGIYVTAVTGTATAAIGTSVIGFGPSNTFPVGGLAMTPGARTYRLQVVHSGAGNFTYSVGASVGGN